MRNDMMHTLILLLLVASAAACKSNTQAELDQTTVAGDTQATPTATETSSEGTTERAMQQAGPVVGEATEDQIVAAHPEWGEIADAWAPNSEAVATIAAADDVTIEVFLGTWCGDSRREVSRWFGAMDDLEGGPTVRYVAVDRRMQAGDVPIPDTLTNVPTFYVSRDGEALGRVVETAVENIEVDIADLISGKRSGFISSSVEP